MNNEETFYQAMRRQGVTRRSFLKYCSLAATSLGLGAGMAPKIAWALENKPRIPVVWIHGLECTCCTESFIRSAHPLAKDVILSLISLDYDDTLMAAAGTQAEEVFEDIITQYNGKYILAVEGNPPLGEQGMFCISSGRPFIEKLKRAAAGASAIIAWGTCASWGCVQAARPNPTQATPIDKVITDKPIIKVPGCPPIPDVMSAIMANVVTTEWSQLQYISTPPAATDMWLNVAQLTIGGGPQFLNVWRTNRYVNRYTEQQFDEYAMRYKLNIDYLDNYLGFARLEVLPGEYGPTNLVRRFYIEFTNMNP